MTADTTRARLVEEAKRLAGLYADSNRQFSGPDSHTWLALCAAIDRLAADQASAQGWLPIETAPKDGTPILIIDDDARHPSPAVAHCHGTTWRAGTASDWAYNPSAMEDQGVYPSPTRWMRFEPPALRNIPADSAAGDGVGEAL